MENAQTANFDDSKWRQVSLPHDYSIEQDIQNLWKQKVDIFQEEQEWYRKSFNQYDKAAEGKRDPLLILAVFI